MDSTAWRHRERSTPVCAGRGAQRRVLGPFLRNALHRRTAQGVAVTTSVLRESAVWRPRNVFPFGRWSSRRSRHGFSDGYAMAANWRQETADGHMGAQVEALRVAVCPIYQDLCLWGERRLQRRSAYQMRTLTSIAKGKWGAAPRECSEGEILSWSVAKTVSGNNFSADDRYRGPSHDPRAA